MTAAVRAISTATKRAYAAAVGADLGLLLGVEGQGQEEGQGQGQEVPGAREYKERHRAGLLRFHQEQVCSICVCGSRCVCGRVEWLCMQLGRGA